LDDCVAARIFEIDDPMISRLHCAVEVTNDAVYLRDLR